MQYWLSDSLMRQLGPVIGLGLDQSLFKKVGALKLAASTRAVVPLVREAPRAFKFRVVISSSANT